jgi:TP901 family phage tail tape measure protein
MRAFSAAFRGVRDIIAGSIRASSEFDDAFTKSTAIMGDLSRVMRDDMVRAAEEVARTTTFSAKEAAEAYFFLASAGLDAAQSIKAMPQVAKFAQAGNFDLATATDLLTDAQSALGMTIRDDVIKNMENMGRVSDVLVKANTLANASVEQFSQALTTKAGAALKILGKDIEEGVAVLAAFADQGVKAAEGGTALNIILRDLSTKAIKNAESFRENKIAVFDAGGEMKNIADIIEDLENRLKGMSDEMAKATLQELGFADKSVIFIQTLIGMSERIREYEEGLRRAGDITETVANKQMQSFAAQTKLVQNNWELFLKTLGDFITQGKIGKEILAFLIDALVRLTDSLVENREQWIRLVGGGIDLALGGIDAFLTGTGLMIAGLAKLGKALLWVGDLLPQTQPESWIRGQRAMVKEMELFGEGLLRGAAEIDLLQEKIQIATKIQLGQVEAEKKASAATLEFRQALVGLQDTLDGVGTKTDSLKQSVQNYGAAVDVVLPSTTRFGREILDVIPHVDTLGVEIETIVPIIERLNLGINQLTPGMRSVGGAVDEFADETIEAADKVGQSIEELAASFQLLGLDASSALGAITIGIAQMARSVPAIKDFNKSLLGDKTLSAGEKFSGILGSIAQGIAGVAQATASGSRGMRMLGGALQGAAAGGQIAGPIGAAIGGAIGGIVGALRGRGTMKIMKEVARDWGVTISEELAKQIEATAKRLDLGRFEAKLLHLSDVIAEVGVGGCSL